MIVHDPAVVCVCVYVYIQRLQFHVFFLFSKGEAPLNPYRLRQALLLSCRQPTRGTRRRCGVDIGDGH